MSEAQQVSQFGAGQATEPPDVQVAAGPDKLFEMVNSTGSVWSKSGSLLNQVDLNVFFQVPVGYSVGDPRLLYDSTSGRWFASGFAFNSSQGSQAYLAVSAGTDPSANWTIYSTVASANLFDQPKIGVTSDKFVMSWNEYSGTTFVGQQTQVIQKSDLLTGTPLTGWLFNLDPNRFNLVPVPVSSAATAYLVYNGNSLRGNPYSGTYVGVVAITGTPASANIAWAETDLSIYATGIPPGAQQPGGTSLQTDDDRFLSAVLTKGLLSVVGNDACLPPTETVVRSCLRVLTISVSGTPTVSQDVDNAVSGFDLFYPAVATDAQGNLGIVTSASSSTSFASAYAAIQPAGSTAGLVWMTLEPGRGPYSSTSCGGTNRWGDYSGAATDPSDPTDIWLAGEYASSATNACDWGTAIGRVTLAAPSVTSFTPSSGSSAGGTQVTIAGRDFVAGATSVSFGQTASPTVTVQSPDHLTAVSPAEASGSVPLTVTTTNGTGTAPSNFTVVAASDTTPPVFQSLSVSPTTVSAGNGVTVTAHITDDISGVASASIAYQIANGSNVAFPFFTRISGTAQDGIWQATVSVPQAAASGVWSVSQLDATDAAGNAGYVSAPAPPTSQGNFTVVGGNDVTPPVFQSLSVSPSSVTPGNSVTVTAHITDDISGVASASIAYQLANGSNVAFPYFTRVAGTAQDGTWQATVSVPQAAASGVWFVNQLDATDAAGNAGYVSAPAPPTAQGNFTVIPPGPAIAFDAPSRTYSFGNQKFGTASPPVNITVTNGGSDTVTVSSACPVTSGEFSAGPGGCAAGFSVAPGASHAVPVTFTPSGTGLRTTSLRFTDNAADSPQTVTLTGNGVYGGQYHPLSPTRIYDTRDGAGALGPGLQGSPARSVSVINIGGVPSTATAVLLNVTVTNTTAASYLTVYPSGVSRPTASNLNWLGGQTVPNLVEVGVGTNGMVDMFNALGSTDVIFDVAGYVGESADSPGAGGFYTPLVPARVLDTRTAIGAPAAAVKGGHQVDVQMTGAGGVPASGVSAVVLNVTTTDTTAPSYLTVFPSDETKPIVSNLNFVAGQTVPNRVVVKVSALGQVSFYNAAGSANVIADVSGWFSDGSPGGTGAGFHPVTPARILDTRDGTGGVRGRVGQAPIAMTAAGIKGIPAMADRTPPVAVVLNVTVTNGTAASYLTLWPDQAQRPTASDLNFTAAQTVPNLVVVKVAADGKVAIFNAAGITDVIVDVVGWYS